MVNRWILATALAWQVSTAPEPAWAQPANANCATPEVVFLGGTVVTTNTNTSFLSGIDLTPACSGLTPPLNAQGQSIAHPVYFRYDALASGVVRVDLTETTETGVVPHDPRLAVLDGLACPPTAAAVIACADGSGTATSTTFSATAGQSYLIVVGGTFVFGTADGTLTLTADFPGVASLTCTGTATGASLLWTLPTFPAGLSYDGGINIYADDGSGVLLLQTLPGTDTQFAYVAPAGFAGFVDFCVEGTSSTAGAAPQACCTVFVGSIPGPANDECSGAESISADVPSPFDTTCANTDSTCSQPDVGGAGIDLGGCLSTTPQMTTINGEVYFCFTVPAAGMYRATVMETAETNAPIPFEPRIAVLDTCGCPPVAAAVIACADSTDGMSVEVEFPAAGGQTILIAVGSFFAFGTGQGTLLIETLAISDPSFRRGDCNGDGALNIADAVAALGILFPPAGCTPGVTCPEAVCADGCDANDDGAFNIADAVALLGFLFPPPGCTPGVSCPSLPAPGVTCGIDPTLDALDCVAYPSCP
ncbi:MAG: dockerin type I repeat-containing protein [Planctomycetota bacterium]